MRTVSKAVPPKPAAAPVSPLQARDPAAGAVVSYAAAASPVASIRAALIAHRALDCTGRRDQRFWYLRSTIAAP